ncbi:DUF6364 family protein [Piscinibacter sp.]|uniref:DUF6364 family protein n=1 Tax=Piscinibacter sp. TaxID=1903157 RepID=UPI0025F68567|nr:DUF6364 family protein [Piscinibacter sp.]
MKTTLDLDDQLLADAKAFAAQQRTSLTRVIEERLQLRLHAKAAAAERQRVRLMSACSSLRRAPITRTMPWRAPGSRRP